MNKYELGIKIDQIKKLAAKKEYTEAAAIAKDINWTKVKDWQALATAINVQEAVGDYEEARDMAILAYNRNLGGRKLVYKLTEFFIKVGDFDNANELYEEYRKSSQHDVSRFILYYDLRKAQNASDNELVGILEDYRDHEIDEKYMYELAKLYYKTGRKEECIKTCDNIVLWFQDGIYVEKAVQLKEKLGVVLTKTQKGILEDVRKRKEDIEATKEELFAKQNTVARKNGTVGSTGSTMPTQPSARHTQPRIRKKRRFSFIGFLSSVSFFRALSPPRGGLQRRGDRRSSAGRKSASRRGSFHACQVCSSARDS